MHRILRAIATRAFTLGIPLSSISWYFLCIIPLDRTVSIAARNSCQGVTKSNNIGDYSGIFSAGLVGRVVCKFFDSFGMHGIDLYQPYRFTGDLWCNSKRSYFSYYTFSLPVLQRVTAQ